MSVLTPPTPHKNIVQVKPDPPSIGEKTSRPDKLALPLQCHFIYTWYISDVVATYECIVNAASCNNMQYGLQ